MDERVIFSHQGVTVSYFKFSVNQKTYPIKDMTSVEPRLLRPKRLFPRLFLFGGLPLVLCRGLLPVLGLALILTGLILGKTAKLRYAVVVHTAKEEYIPLISEESQDIANVISALNVAIVMNARAI